MPQSATSPTSPRAKPVFACNIDAANLGLDDVALGDSIACNGVCLTVVAKEGNHFMVDVSPETLSCTVGLDAPGEINMEKALRLMDRLGGHLVSGHVDGVGEVLRFDPVGDNRLLEIHAPEELAASSRARVRSPSTASA